ncbi:MAG: PadR family transcriptional regulator, partial [Desulfobacula sp.]|nr:PadR family transcriptional regulator [Desulfobacula sp.]
LARQSIKKQTGKPDRHIYNLTQNGHKELVQWLQKPVTRHVGRHEILLKLFFGSKITMADNIKQIKHFQEIQKKELADLKLMQAAMEKENKDELQLPYWLMTIRFGELVNDALIKWSRESIEQLERMNG